MEKTAEKKLGLTEGPIWKKILLFALPIFVGNLFQQLYNAIDSLIAGNFIDSNALASVSSSGSLTFLLIGFFNGVAMGAGVLIGRAYGAKDEKRLEKAIHTDVAFGLLASLLLMVLGVAFTPTILRWMQTPESVLPGSIVYFRVYFAGCVSMVMYNVLQGILHAVGDSRHPLYYLVAASVLNVALDLLFAGVFHWGVGGLALATVLSQFLSAFLCFLRLVRSKEVYRLRIRSIRLDLPTFSEVVRIGLPSGVQNSVISIANLVVQANVNVFGELAMAGCGSYSKIEGFAFLPITCFAMALSTFISQNLGAREYLRAKKGAAFGIACSLLLAELVGVVIYFACPVLVALFDSDPNVVVFGVQQAKTEALFYFLLAFSHCVAGILRGAGKSIVPMLTMLSVWCVIRVSYITIATHFIPEIGVIFWAYPLTWSISSVVFLLYLVKADWIHAYEKHEAKVKAKADSQN